MMTYSSSYGAGSINPLWFLGLGGLGLAVGLVVLVIVIALKGYALWHAAKRDEKWWFIALLIINTVGILELIYLLAVAKVWPKKAPSTGSQPQ